MLRTREMPGDFLLELTRTKDAPIQYELSLKNSPGRFNNLYGAGKAVELIDDKEKATFYFTALLRNNKSSEPNNE